MRRDRLTRSLNLREPMITSIHSVGPQNANRAQKEFDLINAIRLNDKDKLLKQKTV